MKLINFFSRYYIEQKTGSSESAVPGKPQFDIVKETSENSNEKVKITWRPNVNSNPGSHFFVQYRQQGESNFQEGEHVLNANDSYILALEPNKNFEIRVVSVDGINTTPSESQMYSTTYGGLQTFNYVIEILN